MTSTRADWYESNAFEYCERTFQIDMEEARSRFLRHVKARGRILDVGCGSGRDSNRFLALGFDVDARDRSPAIAAEASRRLALTVRVEDVLGMEDVEEFDGIWACAMLVHLDEAEFREATRRLSRALRIGAPLYISLKQDGWVDASEERSFRYWSLAKARADLYTQKPLEPIEEWVTKEGQPRETTWVNLLARKT